MPDDSCDAVYEDRTGRDVVKTLFVWEWCSLNIGAGLLNLL